MFQIEVVLNSITHAKDLVSIAEGTPCEVWLHCHRYVVNAKSLLGVLSLPFMEEAKLSLETEDQQVIDEVLKRLSTFHLLKDESAINDKAYDLVALGEILIDFTQEGVTASGQKIFVQHAGGAPANVLVAASKLGSKTAFLGKVGTDAHGRFLKTTLEAEGVETKGLILDSNFFTTLAFVELDESGERTFSFARKPGADTQIQKEELPLEILKQSRIFHVGSLSLTHQPSYETTFYAVKYAKEHGAMISYDPNYRASLWESEEIAKEVMRQMIPYTDIMKISEVEMELLTDQSTPEAAATCLINQGVQIVLITLGKDGAYLYTEEGGQLIPGYLSHVIDTTGAGDAFLGDFLHSLSQHPILMSQLSLKGLTSHVRLENAVASLCVEQMGAIPAMPLKESVCKRFIGFA